MSTKDINTLQPSRDLLLIVCHIFYGFLLIYQHCCCFWKFCYAVDRIMRKGKRAQFQIKTIKTGKRSR